MKRRLLLVVALLLSSILLTVTLCFAENRGTLRGPARVADEVIVKFDPTFQTAGLDHWQAKYGLQKKRESLKKGSFTVFKHADPQVVVAQLRALPGVIYAEQNAYAYASSVVPNDPFYRYQWDMQRIGMEDAWVLSEGAGAVVAVIDTGVRQSLQDLAQTAFMAGYDFVNGDSDPDDDEGHGSHVCGTIAQATGNGVGVAGVAPQATIMPVKVLDSRGSGSYDDIADGIIWAADQGADVINLSLGGPTDLQVLQDACEYAWNKGVLIVVAAGNEESSQPSYPAAYDVCISVSATTSQDGLASYSNYGSTIDIAAPGGDSDDFNGDGYDDMILQNTFGSSGEGYYFYAGTSMAAPHVAGVAALVKGVNPSISNTELRVLLETSAEDIGAPGKDDLFGNGLLDAYAAVLAAGSSEPINQPPVADFAFVTDGLQVQYTDLSLDADGSVVARSWDFGDGTGSEQSDPVHLYSSPGTYSVSLIVTDDQSAEDRRTTAVTVLDGELSMSVADISLSKTQRGRNYQVRAEITVLSSAGTSVAGATVSVEWSGAVSATATGVTDATGTAVLLSPRYRSDTAITVRVTSVSDEQYPYDPDGNVETEETLN